MDIQVITAQDVGSLTLTGRFDFNTQRSFKVAYDPVLANAAVKKISIDLANVDYIDSSALGMLMLFRERAQAAGKSVELCRPNAIVMQILEIANFRKLFTIV